LAEKKPTRARKRKASTRAPAASALRGRPRHNIYSTYAPIQKDQVEEVAVQEQPLALEVQQAPSQTPEQELQQLQDLLQRM
jgi:hypothetical protein